MGGGVNVITSGPGGKAGPSSSKGAGGDPIPPGSKRWCVDSPEVPPVPPEPDTPFPVPWSGGTYQRSVMVSGQHRMGFLSKDTKATKTTSWALKKTSYRVKTNPLIGAHLPNYFNKE